MKILSKIDSLLIFLLLSIFAVVFFVDDKSYFIRFNRDTTEFKSYVDAKTVFTINKSLTDASGPEIRIENFNDDFDIFISTDGGEKYMLYKNENLLNYKFNDLTVHDISLRSKKVFGDLPKIYSFLIKAKHQSKSIYCKPVVYNYTDDFESNSPILSLVINENDLFGEIEGIMGLGAESWTDSKFYKPFWDRNANYKKRGSDSEKHVYFEFIENLIDNYAGEAAIQISGNATRAFPQKSLKLKAREQYDLPIFNYPFFGKKGLKTYKSLVIRNSGNDNTKTLFADVFMQKMADELPVLVQRGKLTHVFINGIYWGIYNLRERFDTHLIAKYEDVKEKDITILEGGAGELKEGSKKERKKYLKFINEIELLETINNDKISEINETVNLESFKYYILIETFFGNSDWLNNNVLWYKADKKTWKWMLNDLDYGMSYIGEINTTKNYFDDLNNSGSSTAKLFKTLLKNEAFKTEFVETGKKLMITFYENDHILNTFNKFKENLKPNMHFQMIRWRGNFDQNGWENNCNANFEFLQKRRAVFEKQLDKL